MSETNAVLREIKIPLEMNENLSHQIINSSHDSSCISLTFAGKLTNHSIRSFNWPHFLFFKFVFQMGYYENKRNQQMTLSGNT